MTTPKTFPAPPPKWAAGNRSTERRIHQWLVQDDDGLMGAFVSLTAYPFDKPLRFTVTLNAWPPGWERAACVWRLDFDPPYARHTNRGQGIVAAGCSQVIGPNFHSWDTNRHLCKTYGFPEELEAAEPVPPEVRQFDQGFRWFCGRTNILIPTDHMPDWPSTGGKLL